MAKKKTVDTPERDELAQLIADSLNKLDKGGDQVAFFLDGNEDTPTDITDYISTGATLLDIAISNRAHGGIGVGRITEITGLEGSGKSLVCAAIIANTQKRGGVGVLIDTETAVNPQFFSAIGLDTTKLVYAHLQTIEEVFEAVSDVVERVRSTGDNEKLVTIVVDSIAGASSKAEVESDFDNDGYNTHKARAIGKALRKITSVLGRKKIALIFTNQLRTKMNAMPFADPYDVPGGKAIPFAASTRIRLKPVGKIKNKKGEVIGISTKAIIVKNRLGPPHRTAEFDIYFDRGIDDATALLKVATDNKIIKKAGSWCTTVDDNGDEAKFQKGDWSDFLANNPKRREELYNEICDAIIMEYSSEFNPDENFIEESSDD